MTCLYAARSSCQLKSSVVLSGKNFWSTKAARGAQRVKNKYCTACTQGQPPEKHRCYKNWSRSAIILEGFKQAEEVHRVRYKRTVGDGDSSVYPTLLESVPVWGQYIEKIECANHSCKCYRSGLEKLVQDKPSYKGRRGLTKRMRC